MSVCSECWVLSGRGLWDGQMHIQRNRMDVCLLWFLCVVRWRSVRRADPLYREVVWMSVCFKCCVLSGRGLCDGLITRPEESYLLWCVILCDLETSWMRKAWPTTRTNLPQNKKKLSLMNNIVMSQHSFVFGQHVSTLNYIIFRILIFNKHIEKNSMFLVDWFYSFMSLTEGDASHKKSKI